MFEIIDLKLWLMDTFQINIPNKCIRSVTLALVSLILVYIQDKMSHAVLRGKPTAAQLYLDILLDDLLKWQGIKPDVEQRANVTMTHLMFYSLMRMPDAVMMINGATGEVLTNKDLLSRAVPLARALVAAGARGKQVMLVMKNHQQMMVVFFAVLLAGVAPFCMCPITINELTYFIKLIEPSYVFYDKQYDKVLHESLNDTELNPIEFNVDEPGRLDAFVEDFSKDFYNYHLPDISPEDTMILLPTSGSTGLPKAVELTQKGLMIQLPTPWMYHTKFPTPTKLVLILTKIEWMTFTMMITACVVYQVTILISPAVNTVENVIQLLENYRPTFTYYAPAFGSAMLSETSRDQWSSLETLILLGEPSTPKLKKTLQEKLSDGAHLCDGYGLTETHGFVTLSEKNAPWNFNGRVINCLQYKIVDEFGKKLGLNQTGELYVKGPCLIKQYYKSNELKEYLTNDGWFMTGDIFYVDENEILSFVSKKKFSFKFKDCQVVPEEVERVILSVAGVRECVVCASESGPAAAVVMQPNVLVTRESVHAAIKASLSEHKSLQGGIVFVPSLPHTRTGKIHRVECKKLVINAIASGDCY